MLDFIMSNIANIIVIAAVLAVVFLAVRSLVKSRKEGKSSCGCGCSNCAMAGKCHQIREQKGK